MSNYSNSRHSTGPHVSRRVDRGRGYKRVSGSHVEVYDLDMAAYVHMRNIPIVEASKTGREIVVVFLDPVEKNLVDKIATEWLNSEAAKFANCLRSLKKVALSTERVYKSK